MDLKLAIHKLSNITRAGDWRFSFVPFIIGCVYLWFYWFQLPFTGSTLLLLTFSLITTFGFAALGYFINEFFDRELDAKAGKINRMSLLNPAQRLGLLVCILFATFLPWVYLPSNEVSFLLISLEIALFLVYSLPIIRLKEKPFLSSFIDASYAYVVPLVLSFYTYSIYAGKSPFSLFFVFFISAVFFIGFRNITIHHINDVFKDIKAGVVTLPQILGPAKTNVLIYTLIVLEIIAFSLSCVCISIEFPYVFVWCILYFVLLIYSIYNLNFRFDRYFCVNPARHLTDKAYQIWFPIFLLVLLVTEDWRWVFVFIVHFFVLVPFSFFKNTYIVLRLKVRPILSVTINYSIYYTMKLFGVDLKKENKSLLEFFMRGKK